jgi:hypothetical protein
MRSFIFLSIYLILPAAELRCSVHGSKKFLDELYKNEIYKTQLQDVKKQPKIC